MSSPFAFVLLSAFTFAAWPIVGRFSGLSAIWVSTVVSLSTLVLVVAAKPLFANEETPQAKALVIGVIAGALNGLGILAFNKITSNKSLDITIYVPMTFGLMLVLASIGGVIVFGESMTQNKVWGMVAILVGVYLLR